MMTGSIDLLCRWQGKYYVIDYKTNHLGDQLEDYSPAGLKQAIEHHHYDLQYLIYTVALKKMLAIASPSESFEDLFGGVIYLFLRGMIGNHNQGVFFDRVDVKAIEAIELALNP
jgi:exodeoxyribonuclease V beta subunit